MKLKYILAIAGLLSVGAGKTFAQSEVDVDTASFNALKYSLQERRRPHDEEFVPFSFFYLQAGTEQMVRRSSSDYGWGPVAREVLGMRLDKYNSVAVSVEGYTARRNADARRIIRGGIGLQHYFDLTSYIGGYKPSRTLSLYTVEQISYFRSHYISNNGKSFGIRGGLVLSFKVSDSWNVNVEPYAAIYSDNIDPGTPFNWRKFDGGYGVTAGLSHRFDFRKQRVYTEHRGFGQWFTDNSFVSLSAGPQFYGSGHSISEGDFFSSVREHVSLSYGRLLSGPLGLRVSVFESGNSWDNSSALRQKSNLFGFRGEIMFDPVYYAGRKADRVFSMPLFIGAEAAHFNKRGSDIRLNKWYGGLTGGFQLKFRTGRSTSLFLEPRFSLVPYTSNAGNGSASAFKNYFDAIANVNFGVQIDL